MIGRLAISLFLCGAARGLDDASVMLQINEAGDMGKDMSSRQEPPIPLASIPASNFLIPTLGSSKSLTQDVTAFKFWKVNDDTHRAFKSVDSEGYFQYGTRPEKKSYRARSVLYDATTNKKLAAVWMDTKDAAIRGLPLDKMVTKPVQMLREGLGYAYHINVYKPLCAGQGPVGSDMVDGSPLYAFATVSKVTGHERFHVERIRCEVNDAGQSEAKYRAAYTLAKHGMRTAYDAVAPDVGVIGTMDTVLSRDWAADGTGNTFRKHFDAWLAKGEDPALFQLALMVTQMPEH